MQTDNAPDGTQATAEVSFSLERETKGALRYQEVNDLGQPITQPDHYMIGTLYVRKHVFRGERPKFLNITVSY